MNAAMRTALPLRVLLAIIVAVLSHAAVAQLAPGAIYISGSVTSAETSLPAATITAKNIANSQAISTVSDAHGQYRLGVSGPGTYLVAVDLSGFSSAHRTVSLMDQPVQVDFRLARATTRRAQRPSAAASGGGRPKSNDDGSSPKSSAPLSADVPMDFSFVHGNVAQAVTAEANPAARGPLRDSPIHGNVFYQSGNSALDASPYTLHGLARDKPDYAQHSFGAAASGPLPWVKRGTTIFGQYFGNRSADMYNGFATVPTAALRTGDFSTPNAFGQSLTVYDPMTGQPFPGNRIPLSRMSPAAVALLRYMPLPTRDGLSQNFGFVTAADTSVDTFSLSLAHAPPTLATPAKGVPVRNSFSAQVGYRRSASDAPNVFPLLGGDTAAQGWNVGVGHTLVRQFFTNDLRLAFTDSSVHTANRFHSDVASALGINGASRDPFDWGLPSVELAQFTGLRDTVPALQAERNFSFTDALSWSHGSHNLKWGGEFHRAGFDVRRSADAAGSFLFTGFATAQFLNGVAVPGTGSDFADFLLGLPQKTHVQYSGGAFSFHGNVWNLYFVDDWRLARNLTLNLGLRYEYVSPLAEARDRLVTLDALAGFSAVTPVVGGVVGPFSGRFPRTIMAPDRNNFAPRVGLAWRAAERVVVRAGYSIGYDPSLYTSLAPRLALQPPFAVGQTGIAGTGQALTLTHGFPSLLPDSVANDFAVPRNLPLGYAQIWVLEMQNDLPGGMALVTAYTGTKGSHLPLLRAPNRTATGLLLPNVEPFLWQTADGSSTLHAGSVRLQKRLSNGLSFGASYMFSRSIDNVPSLGDEVSVAQNDAQYYRDRGLSAFDQRHRVTFDYRFELPFGRGKPWLRDSAAASRALGGWSLTGALRWGSGFPLSPHVVGDFADVAAGAYGALRPDVTGQPVALPHATPERFFNTAAFISAPPGQYGNAGRNTIIGPSSLAFDAAVARSFTIAEGHTVRVEAQASNLLNRPQYTQVDTNLNSPSYGQITGVGAMRALQLALRYIF